MQEWIEVLPEQNASLFSCVLSALLFWRGGKSLSCHFSNGSIVLNNFMVQYKLSFSNSQVLNDIFKLEKNGKCWTVILLIVDYSSIMWMCTGIGQEFSDLIAFFHLTI